MMAALGTTARLVQLSIYAKIGMTSPTETDARVGGGGDGARSCLKEFLHNITQGTRFNPQEHVPRGPVTSAVHT